MIEGPLKESLDEYWKQSARTKEVVKNIMSRHGHGDKQISETDDCTALRARVARLEEVLREIRDYSSYDHPDIQVLNHRNQVIVEINECSACQHAKQAKWPPSGLCPEHYNKYQMAQRRVEEMHDYKQTWEPREIARRALEEK